MDRSRHRAISTAASSGSGRSSMRRTSSSIAPPSCKALWTSLAQWVERAGDKVLLEVARHSAGPLTH